ncbi:SDR family oxidoreductase [Spirosoma linguale]|uniref:Short-chain dehydrogenase/reductase SDR n=1 Tax=Spirosoma linguale (strain ATCC 33905 / DSM 74 / LMG 10896 / Claus 1) TaxID=504472 RepID=D2QPZ9_SPILD|nr:short-chain dehydrogenase/reductase SDR [Spirosoma linguale DSM 74]
MKDKLVLITGASSGIGRALAFAFGREGAIVVICARKADALQLVSDELRQAGINTFSLTADVSIESDVKQLIDQTIARFGRLDILINNAGISMRSMLIDTDPAVIQKVMDINFMGTVYATRYALPYIQQTKGSIVGISSIAGYRGLPVRSGYSASKFAMNGFLEAVRTELLHTDVHVLTACPGFTASNIRFSALDAHGQAKGETMRDESNMMSAEECADHILRAVKTRKRELILTSQGKFTVFLNKWLPKLMDKLVYNTLAKEKDSPLKK